MGEIGDFTPEEMVVYVLTYCGLVTPLMTQSGSPLIRAMAWCRHQCWLTVSGALWEKFHKNCWRYQSFKIVATPLLGANELMLQANGCSTNPYNILPWLRPAKSPLHYDVMTRNYWPFVRRIHRWVPHTKWPVMFSLLLAWTNCWQTVELLMIFDALTRTWGSLSYIERYTYKILTRYLQDTYKILFWW